MPGVHTSVAASPCRHPAASSWAHHALTRLGCRALLAVTISHRPAATCARSLQGRQAHGTDGEPRQSGAVLRREREAPVLLFQAALAACRHEFAPQAAAGDWCAHTQLIFPFGPTGRLLRRWSLEQGIHGRPARCK